MYSFDEIETLTAKIRWMATELLGDRVSAVQVEARDIGYFVGLAIKSPDGWRHAVGAPTVHVIADPEKWTRNACASIAAWLDAKAAATTQQGTQ